MPVWLVKTRQDPSRHCKDAKVYGPAHYGYDCHTPTPNPQPCENLSTRSKCARTNKETYANARYHVVFRGIAFRQNTLTATVSLVHSSWMLLLLLLLQVLLSFSAGVLQ